MTKHTSEPWNNPEGFEFEIYKGEDNPLAEFSGFHEKADAIRAVQCVNALAGIEDPAATLALVRDVLKRCAGELEFVAATAIGNEDPGLHPIPMSQKALAKKARAALTALNRK